MFETLKEGIQELRAIHIGKRANKAMQRDDYRKGVALFRKALNIMEDTFGEIPQTVVYVWNLAEALEYCGHYEEAEHYFRRALSFVEDHPGQAFISKVEVLNKLHFVLDQQEKTLEAEQLKGLGSDVDQSEYERLTTYYYLHGTPDKAASLLKYFFNLSNEFAEIYKQGRDNPSTFFFSRIAYGHPSIYREYESLFRISSHKERVFILYVLELGDDDGITTFLKSIVDDHEYISEKFLIKSILDKGGNKKLDPLSVVPHTGHDLDLLWVEYIVTGNTEAVSRIIQVLDRPDIIRKKLEEWLKKPLILGFIANRYRRSVILEKVNEPIKVIRAITDKPWTTNGIQCDLDKSKVITFEDLDCLCALSQVEAREQADFQHILDAFPFYLDKDEIGLIVTKAAAKWSLCSNAKIHQPVLDTCISELTKYKGRSKLSLLHVVIEAEEKSYKWLQALPHIQEFLEVEPSNLEMRGYLEIALREEKYSLLENSTFSEKIEKLDKDESAVSDPEVVNGVIETIANSRSYRSVMTLKDFYFSDPSIKDNEVMKWKFEFCQPHLFRAVQDCYIANWPEGFLDEWITMGNFEFSQLGPWSAQETERHREEVESIFPVEILSDVLSDDAIEKKIYKSSLEEAFIIECRLSFNDLYGQWEMRHFIFELINAMTHLIAYINEDQIQFIYQPIYTENDPKVSIFRYANSRIMRENFSCTLNLLVEKKTMLVQKSELHLMGKADTGQHIELLLEQIFGDYNTEITISEPDQTVN
ncbi:MAG: tetratricopeptide repeat protein [Sedimenticola sp.]